MTATALHKGMPIVPLVAKNYHFLYPSDDSRYMVGSELLLDGGMRVK